MKTSSFDPDPAHQLRTMFQSKIALDGGIVRRKKRDVERLIGLDFFLREMQRRGYQVFENAGYILVLCNTEPLSRLQSRVSPEKLI